MESLVRTFDMNRRIFQNSALYYAQSLQRKFMIEFISPDQIRAISDIAITIVQGRVADKCSLSCKNGFFLITRYVYYTIVLFQLYHDT
jgi:hypothetical protein